MIISLAQMLLGKEDYHALGSFFIDTWRKRDGQNSAEDYRYRVYIARRCQLLNEIFYQEKPATDFGGKRGKATGLFEETRKNTFLNQYGLMCKARELAECYGSEVQGFPPILIVDELTIYGREISRLLLKMTELIVEAYAEQFGPVSSETESRIRRDFLSAVDIRVYGRNQKKLLLSDAVESRLTAVEEMPTKRWREFVRSVSALIRHTGGIGNKSYYPLFSVPKDSLSGPDREEARSYSYHGSRFRVYQTKKDGILFTFCEREAGAKRELLPIPLWGDLPKERAKRLLEETAEVFASNAKCQSRTDFCNVIALLRESSLGLLQVQFQLISFIMAVLSFCDFARERGLPCIDGVDIDRCAMSFGTVKEFEAELREITDGKNEALCEELKKIIYAAFSESEELYAPVEGENSGDTEKLLRAAETYFLSISDADERALAAMREDEIVFDALTRDYDVVSLQDYLNAEGISGSIEDRVFSLILLLMDGQVSMNVRLYDGKMQLRLKTGEYVKSIEAERIRQFIPVLSALEDWCVRAGYSPEHKLCEFGRFLGELDPTRYGELGETFRTFANAQYVCGDTVSDWNIGFTGESSLPDTKRGEWLVDPWSGRAWSEEEKEHYASRGLSPMQWEKEQCAEAIEQLKLYVKLISGRDADPS